MVGDYEADRHDIDIGNAGERMVAGSGNWGYYAHLSLYHLAAPLVHGKRILEAGCGTGYGSVYLSGYGPTSITACDISDDAVSFCRREYKDHNVIFGVADLGKSLPYDDGQFDFIFSSNAMEHIGPIDVFLSECKRVLATGGKFFIAVPPNHSPGALEENIRNIFHITNLTPLGWYTKIFRYFGVVRSFRHWPSGQYSPEERVLADIPLPAELTTIREIDFGLEEMPIDILNTLPQNITAVFIAEEPRDRILPESIREFVPQEWFYGAIVSKVIQGEREVARLAQAEAADLRAENARQRQDLDRLTQTLGSMDAQHVNPLHRLLDGDVKRRKSPSVVKRLKRLLRAKNKS
jgi:SAM-dependent methyltransferase